MVVTLLKNREHYSRAICYYPPMMEIEIIHASPHVFFYSRSLVCLSCWLNYNMACITDAVNGYLVNTVDMDIRLPPTSPFKTSLSVIHVQPR